MTPVMIRDLGHRSGMLKLYFVEQILFFFTKMDICSEK